MPGRVRAGMTVQQHHRFPVAAVPHAEPYIADIDTVQLEAVKHEPQLPHAIQREPRWEAAQDWPGDARRHDRASATGCAAPDGQFCAHEGWLANGCGLAAGHVSGVAGREVRITPLSSVGGT